jgi:hypothetical protein
VGDQLLHQVRADLHFADPRLGLRVEDPHASAGGVVQADVAQPHVAELARPQARAAEGRDDRTAAAVLPGRSGVEIDIPGSF